MRIAKSKPVIKEFAWCGETWHPSSPKTWHVCEDLSDGDPMFLIEMDDGSVVTVVDETNNSIWWHSWPR